MQTNVRPTSIDTYHSLKSKFGAQACKIMAFMKDNAHLTFTRRELAECLELETSSVSGRVNQLVKDGDLIELTEKRKCSITGITAIALSLPVAGQKKLFD
jgi:DNA-binding MarR family transcriptional regulator